MAKKRIVTNLFEDYLEKKGISDDKMAKHLGVNRKTFGSMRRNPLSIKIGFAYKIAMYFKEYVPYFIDHVLIGECLDEKQHINTDGNDWDLKVVSEMKNATMRDMTSDNERIVTEKKVEKIPTISPSKIDPITGVVQLIDDKADEHE